MRKVELLPTQDCEAGYGPVQKLVRKVDVPIRYIMFPLQMLGIGSLKFHL